MGSPAPRLQPRQLGDPISLPRSSWGRAEATLHGASPRPLSLAGFLHLFPACCPLSPLTPSPVSPASTKVLISGSAPGKPNLRQTPCEERSRAWCGHMHSKNKLSPRACWLLSLISRHWRRSSDTKRQNASACGADIFPFGLTRRLS